MLNEISKLVLLVFKSVHLKKYNNMHLVNRLTYRWHCCHLQSFQRCGFQKRQPQPPKSAASGGRVGWWAWAWMRPNCWRRPPSWSPWSGTWVRPPRWGSRCSASSMGCSAPDHRLRPGVCAPVPCACPMGRGIRH